MIEITHAEPSNVKALANLTEETGRFYGATQIDTLDLRIRQINEALFQAPRLLTRSWHGMTASWPDSPHIPSCGLRLA